MIVIACIFYIVKSAITDKFIWEKRVLVIMCYRYNVSCSETLAKNWTPTAIDCYHIGCNCAKCNLYYIYFKDSLFKCKMKDTVIELVRKLGVPQKDREEI